MIFNLFLFWFFSPFAYPTQDQKRPGEVCPGPDAHQQTAAPVSPHHPSQRAGHPEPETTQRRAADWRHTLSGVQRHCDCSSEPRRGGGHVYDLMMDGWQRMVR